MKYIVTSDHGPTLLFLPILFNMRVAQYIGQSGFSSRQVAKQLIEDRRVKVNGKVATHSTKITEGDKVTVDGKDIYKNVLIVPDQPKKKKKEEVTFKATYIAYHKPTGIVSTTESIKDNIIDAIGHEQNILPIGRLDKESEGLILLTNVGEIIDKIINPKYKHEKEYEVTLNLPVSSKFIRDAAEGIDIGGEKTLPCEIRVTPGTKRVFKVVLKQGLNRQIRRMCNAYGYQVVKLKRLRVINIKLGTLKPGEWRDLSEDELNDLLAIIY